MKQEAALLASGVRLDFVIEQESPVCALWAGCPRANLLVASRWRMPCSPLGAAISAFAALPVVAAELHSPGHTGAVVAAKKEGAEMESRSQSLPAKPPVPGRRGSARRAPQNDRCYGRNGLGFGRAGRLQKLCL